ncbi:hypothetical protein V2S66_31040 [Streptomyces sp. V4-01]|uniref:Uncharacterized protein n=1 Tax=Actinacidiphila polyblastidii TaxID=3110430 RepID=A0ABU7PKY7_9ACTN|nr:hypothetical protein [Streptomyces sp. V4-01]
MPAWHAPPADTQPLPRSTAKAPPPAASTSTTATAVVRPRALDLRRPASG